MSEVRIPSLLPEQQPAGRSLIEEVGDEPVTETPHFEIVQRGNFDLSEHTFGWFCVPLKFLEEGVG